MPNAQSNYIKTMTTIEHLNKIKAKCEFMLTLDRSQETHSRRDDLSEAGWRSTIAAIDLFLFNDERLSYGYAPSKQERQIVQSILSAWPEELLN
jgi:hypothetical protein